MRRCAHVGISNVSQWRYAFKVELQQPFPGSPFFRDKPHNIFIQPTLNDVRMHVGRETILILFLSEFLFTYLLGSCCITSI